MAIFAACAAGITSVALPASVSALPSTATAPPTASTARLSPTQNGLHEWECKQVHKDSGKITIRFSESAIKISNVSMGYNILAKAPDWSVSIFRDDDKIIWKMPLKDYYKSYPVDLTGLATKHKGLPRKRAIDGSGARSWSYAIGSDEYWYAEHVDVASQVGAIICGYYQLRAQKGILTKYVLELGEAKAGNTWLDSFKRTGRTTYLYTISFREVPYNAADFAVPVAYKKAPDPYSITTSKTSKKDGDDIIRQMGLGEKFGR